MSTDLYLYKPDKKERYDLGEGDWFMIFNYGESFKCAFSPNGLFEVILECIASRLPDKVTLGTLRKWAEDIVAWCGQDNIEFWELNSFINKYSTADAPLIKSHPVTGGRKLPRK
jgi:hypothetical protein